MVKDMAQYRHESKCIYCLQSVVKRNLSVEHVMPKCMLQKGVHALTLKNHVCRTCNSSFYYETFFSELTDVALMNQQVRCNSDNTVIPDEFFTNNFSKCRINGKEYSRPYVSSIQIDRDLNGKLYMNFNFDVNAQRGLLRGMAKIGLNALLVKYQKTPRDFRIVEHENTNYSGHEDEFTPLKKFITGETPENRFVGRIEDLNDPCLVQLESETRNPISPNEVSQTMHIIDIHKYEGALFCFVTLFLGLENPGAIYCISLNKQLPVELPVEDGKPLPMSTRVRTIQFNYHLSGNSPIRKDRKRFEPILIEPVNHPTWIYAVNDSRN